MRCPKLNRLLMGFNMHASPKQLPTMHNSMGNNEWVLTKSEYIEEKTLIGYKEPEHIPYGLAMFANQEPVYETKLVWKSVVVEKFVF